MSQNKTMWHKTNLYVSKQNNMPQNNAIYYKAIQYVKAKQHVTKQNNMPQNKSIRGKRKQYTTKQNNIVLKQNIIYHRPNMLQKKTIYHKTTQLPHAECISLYPSLSHLYKECPEAPVSDMLTENPIYEVNTVQQRNM